MPKLGQDKKQTYASLQAGTNPPFHGVCVCACVCVCVCVCVCCVCVGVCCGWRRREVGFDLKINKIRLRQITSYQ